MRLHSRDPEHEARKYFDSLELNAALTAIILLECGHGYLIPLVRARFPAAKIISVHLFDEFTGNDADAEWSPAALESCTEFLEREIGDVEATRVKLIEWRPAFTASPAAYARLLTEIAAFLALSDANTRTTRHFLRRWEQNCRRNIRFFAENARRTALTLAPLTCSIVVCAAGPSLEDAIARISALKAEGAAVLAVSSAVAALTARGIVPDIVVTSDGGGWARAHLFELERVCRRYAARPLVAATLNAALISGLAAFPLALISDGSAGQNALLAEAGLPPFKLPQRGTVTASALEFALSFTSSGIWLAGADFACRDLRSHARPYAFDALLMGEASRLAPWYQRQWERSRALEAGGSHAVFARWFARAFPRYEGRLKMIETP